jgi:ubiquinol-cytochrome c reductase iron-sulfur subunit
VKHGRVVTFCLLASFAASIGLTAVYISGGQPQLEGLFLAIALGGIGVGLAVFAKEALPRGPFVQQRSLLPGTEDAEKDAERAFELGAEAIGRRGFLAKLLGLALGGLGIAALFPIRSLGTNPGRELFETPWADGVRVVTEDGEPVVADSLSVNGVLTVFPEGHTDAADAQTLLIRLPGDVTAPGPAGASVEGMVAFSKICTHAGCPVGLYQADSKELFCPCHQSVFAVLQAAAPTGGPATRPLPQLPIGIDSSGYLVALGDFPEPVGPGFWNRDRD